MSRETELRRNARDGGSQAETLQRWGMLLGGGALTVYALTRRRPGTRVGCGGRALGVPGSDVGHDEVSGAGQLCHQLRAGDGFSNVARAGEFADFHAVPGIGARAGQRAVGVDGDWSDGEEAALERGDH